uniref:Uncharacterized protein n=1 Tax=Phytophthora fragariae TaxID=53985 RepID=A0A6A3F3A6_9STRA|nr:hypothetical protein PF009_g10262 [Phytophthora fragariae]
MLIPQADDFVLHDETNKFFIGIWEIPESTRNRTMEPLEAMLETHREECSLARRFKESGEKQFRKFCSDDWTDSCMSKAMPIAAKLSACDRRVFAEGLSKLDVDLSPAAPGSSSSLSCNKKYFGHAIVLHVKNNVMRKTGIDKGTGMVVDECTWVNFIRLFVRSASNKCTLIV